MDSHSFFLLIRYTWGAYSYDSQSKAPLSHRRSGMLLLIVVVVVAVVVVVVVVVVVIA